MPTNEILEFAGSADALSVLSPTDYAADAGRVYGHGAGIARLELENSVLRNLSRFARGVAAFVAERYAPGVVDDGDASKIVAGMVAAITSVVSSTFPLVVQAAGTANALTGTLATPPQQALTHGMQVAVRAATASTSTTPTFRLTLGTTDTGAVGIVGPGGATLAVGAISGAGHWLLLTYDSTLAKWMLLNPAVTPSGTALVGAARNLKIASTGSSPLASITADELVVKDSTGAARLLTGVNVTVSTAVSGIGGLDTGVASTNTWYAVHVVAKPDGTVGAILSLSATAPTLPTGYTYSCFVGWRRTDGTANKYPKAMTQIGRRVQYIVNPGGNVLALPSLASGVAGDISNPTYVAVAVGGAVPPTAAVIHLGLFNNTALACALVAPNPNYGAYITQASPPPITQYPSGAAGEAVSISSFLLESPNVYWASNAPATNLFCLGWEE